MKCIKSIQLHEDIKINGMWRTSFNRTISYKNYELCSTLSGRRWFSLLKRCKTGGAEQNRNTSYIGSKNDFPTFQEFVEWSQGEVGYNLREEIGENSWSYSLDKDILGGGSKIYSKETCVFVPSNVNAFLCASGASRGPHPIGVTWKTKNNKFESQIRQGKFNRYLGLYSDPLDAHRAWQLAKVEVGRNLALEFKDWHGKLYNGMNSWLDKIQDDYTAYRESVFI